MNSPSSVLRAGIAVSLLFGPSISSSSAATVYAAISGTWESNIWRPGTTGSVVSGLRPSDGDDANLSTTTAARSLVVNTVVPSGTNDPKLLNVISKGTTATDVTLNIEPKGHLRYSRFMNCTSGPGAKFTINLGAGGRITCTGVLNEGGVLLAGGADSTGTVNQTGGTFEVSELPSAGLQITGGANASAEGTYTISGGLLRSGKMIRLGVGTSELNISDVAEVEVGSGGITNAENAISSTINLSGGSLVIDGALKSVLSTPMAFNWSGGRFAAKEVENILLLKNAGTGVLDICGEEAGTFVHKGQGTTTYEQGNQASMRIEISGTGAGQYDVFDGTQGTGSIVILEGAIDIYLIGNYVPASGAHFDIIKAHGIDASDVELRGPAAERFTHTVVDLGTHKVLRLTAVQGPTYSTKPWFKTLWNNDLTNIINQSADYNRRRGFSKEILEASIDETGNTGIDVHLLAMNVGWTPVWQSNVLPISTHMGWIQSIEGIDFSNDILKRLPNRFDRFLTEESEPGVPNDILKIFVDRCHLEGANNPLAFVSYRLNDYHHLSIGLNETDSPEQNENNVANSQFYYEHPELRVGPGAEPNTTERTEFVNSYQQDWSFPEVRQYKLRMIKELIEKYDIDGIELDFMRHWVFFNKDVPNAERMRIMRNFVREVRAALDRKPGRHRYLSVRICGYITDGSPPSNLLERSGVDLVGFANAGVEMFNLTHHYFTDLQLAVKAIRDTLPSNVAVYVESHYTNAYRTAGVAGQTVAHRRSTEADQYTAAHVAYSKGADGISTFNMHYHRNDASASTDNYELEYEPEFPMFANLKDKAFIAQQDQSYVIGLTQAGPKKSGRPLVGVPVIDIANPALASKNATIYMYPPTNGWANEGRIRVQGVSSLGTAEYELYINDVLITTTSTDFSEATFGGKEYDDQNHGNNNEYRAWTFTKDKLIPNAANKFTIKLTSGTSPQLFYLNIAIPSAPAP